MQDLENKIIEGHDWWPCGVGALYHCNRITQEKKLKPERLNARQTFEFVTYSIYQIGSLGAAVYLAASLLSR